MEKFIRRLSLFLAVLAAGSIVVMVVAIALDVLVRNATGASLPGMIEVAETSLVISVFFGMALAGVNGEHVAVTLLTDRLNEIWAGRANIFAWSMSCVVIVWMLYATTQRAIDSTQMSEERFGLIRWPLYPMRWVIVVGLAVLMLVALVNLIRTLKGNSPMGSADEVEAVLATQTSLPQSGNQAAPVVATASEELPELTNSGGRVL